MSRIHASVVMSRIHAFVVMSRVEKECRRVGGREKEPQRETETQGREKQNPYLKLVDDLFLGSAGCCNSSGSPEVLGCLFQGLLLVLVLRTAGTSLQDTINISCGKSITIITIPSNLFLKMWVN